MSDNKTIRLKAMDLLARREHSRVELLDKLGQRFPEQAALVAEVVAGLSREGLQSDRRFAESYARLRLERGFGPLRIEAELRQRGIDDELISDSLAQLAVDWWAAAQAACSKKFGDAVAADYREQAKRMRFLQQRGFSYEQIRAAVEA